MSAEDVESGVRVTLYTCPFLLIGGGSCTYKTSDRSRLLHHIAASVFGATHRGAITDICAEDYPWMTRLAYVYGAVSVFEGAVASSRTQLDLSYFESLVSQV